MNKFNLKIFCISVMILVFAACGNEAVDEEKTEEHHEDEENVVEISGAQMKNAGIEFGSVQEKQISGTIRVNGVLDVPPQQLISISAPLGGFLKNTSLLEGSRVKKGQVIASIENLEFIQIQQDYLDAKSNFEFAEADYERQQDLARANVNSEKTLQQAKSNYASWQARYQGLREKLKVLNLNVSSVEQGNIRSLINLYSPINGYVTEVNVNIGKFVNPTDVLFEIVDTDHLHAELIVFEKDVRKLKIGQKVRFTLANETDERTATVYLIGREIGEDRTIQIHCHIEEEDKELLPGMYLNAVVETGGARVPALPDEAIIDYQGKKYIFISLERTEADTVKGRYFKMIPVETGDSEFGFTVINANLPPESQNRKVVIKGAYSLLSKMMNSEEEGGHAH